MPLARRFTGLGAPRCDTLHITVASCPSNPCSGSSEALPVRVSGFLMDHFRLVHAVNLSRLVRVFVES
jgi:hypothetical protein